MHNILASTFIAALEVALNISVRNSTDIVAMTLTTTTHKHDNHGIWSKSMGQRYVKNLLIQSLATPKESMYKCRHAVYT